MRPPVRSLRRRATSDNYDRKLKPTPKKTRKTRQKTKKHLKVALLALGVLAIIPGMIAGSALTKSAEQVPNVVTQVSVAYCAYIAGGDWDSFGKCMLGFWAPMVSTLLIVDRLSHRDLREGRQTIREGKVLRDRDLVRIGKQLVRSAASWMRYTKVGFVVLGA